MKDPARLLHDRDAPRELQALLRRAPRARELDAAARERGRLRVLHLAAPAAFLAGLSVSTSAVAIGALTGVLAGAVTIGAVVLVRPVFEGEADGALAPRVGPARAVLRAPVAPERAATVLTEPRAPAAPASASSAPAPRAFGAPALALPVPAHSAAGLAAESRLLELARRALQANPAEALELAREHERRFARPRLAAERTLIAIEALYRLDRHAQARALAEQWLARGADDLYRERVQRLLEKID